jgi:hypothetical protein
MHTTTHTIKWYIGPLGPWRPRRLRLPDFKKIGTRRWQCFQPYAPAAFTPKIPLVLIPFRGQVDTRATVQPEGLSRWKISKTSSGFEPATFRIVAQCLNQLRHCLPRCVYGWFTILYKLCAFAGAWMNMDINWRPASLPTRFADEEDTSGYPASNPFGIMWASQPVWTLSLPVNEPDSPA